ncbi:hypothetical protein LPJ61_002337 [Coemansia biformis]|uniref:Afadin and alpha-actinin-binding-domain-containing protein n=1 Tax=Coemansia biformis TaxID=1286918 RepID=A0A9W7YD97_9FUNG|nr:hypothetical protein LPJ61_002337 [Coemansia biformis]
MWSGSPGYGAGSGRPAGNGYESFDEAGDFLGRAATPEQTYGGVRQMEQTSMSIARERMAAAGTNPYAALHHINRELMELGLPSPLVLAELPECLEDNQRVVECLSAMLVQRRRDLGFRETVDGELRKAMGEEDMLRTTIARLERELDQSQRESAGHRHKWEESQRNAMEGERQRKLLAAELRTTRSNAAMVKAQYLHDGKKREQESIRLKERMQKLIVDKHGKAELSMKLANPIERDRSGRPVEPAAGRDRRLLEELIGRYEASETELVARVESLEAMLRKLVAALRLLHGDVVPDAAATPRGAEDGDSAVSDVAPALGLVEVIRDCVHLERSQQPAPADHAELDRRSARIEELQATVDRQQQQLGELQKVLEEQRKIMDMSSAKRLASKVDVMDMSFSEMNLEQLDAEREEVRRERQQLEDERRRFTEAAIELGNERSGLKRDREAFERQRTQQATADLVGNLPPTPQWMKGIDTSQATPMILHQLQASYGGTPTNALLASMNAAYNAGLATAADATANASAESRTPKSPEEEFPEIGAGARSPAAGRDADAQFSRSSSSAGMARQQGTRTPARPLSQRTPAEVRSGRQPRVCTRPGCAAHAPHTHDDGGGGGSAQVMELKPPVPRFRRRADDPADSPSQASTVSAKPRRTANASSSAAADLFR